MSISLEIARTIIAAALEHGTEAGFKPLSVVVLDAGGHVIAFERQDGSSNRRFDIAFGKAHGAISIGMGSRALMSIAEEQPSLIAGATAAIGGALVPVPGGLLVADPSGAVVGAVGVTGDTADNDESAGVAGIEAAGLRAITGMM